MDNSLSLGVLRWLSTQPKMNNWLFEVILWTQLSGCCSNSCKQSTFAVQSAVHNLGGVDDMEQRINISTERFWSPFIYMDLEMNSINVRAGATEKYSLMYTCTTLYLINNTWCLWNMFIQLNVYYLNMQEFLMDLD